MKLFLITLFISIPCFAEDSSWPLDNEKNLPSLLDPQKPYVDTNVEENKYLENLSRQVLEQTIEVDDQSKLVTTQQEQELTPSTEEFLGTPAVEE